MLAVEQRGTGLDGLEVELDVGAEVNLGCLQPPVGDALIVEGKRHDDEYTLGHGGLSERGTGATVARARCAS